MTQPADRLPVYLEVGQKRVFAAAVDWPGWSRSGKSVDDALATLLVYGPRYARAVAADALDLVAPEEAAALAVVERLPGSSGTDFGAPGSMPAADTQPFDAAALARALAILSAIWQSFDAAAESAVGVALRKGPRGGGGGQEAEVAPLRGAGAADQ